MQRWRFLVEGDIVATLDAIDGYTGTRDSLLCYDYDVLVLLSFLPCTPIRVETICFVRIFKTIQIYLSPQWFHKRT